MLRLISKWKIHGWIHGWGKEEKKKDKEYKNWRTRIICIFIWQTKLNQTYNALLDVKFITCDSWNPPPVHGWEPHPWIYPKVAFSKFKNPQAFISSRSVALTSSFHIIGPPHPWIFHPTRGLLQRSMDGDYPRVACNTPLSFLSSMGLPTPGSPNPLCSPSLYPASISTRFFLLLCSCPRFPEIALVLPRDCRLPPALLRLPNPRDRSGCASAAELQSLRWKVAFGLTKRNSIVKIWL